jgi:hypothetical protein
MKHVCPHPSYLHGMWAYLCVPIQRPSQLALVSWGKHPALNAEASPSVVGTSVHAPPGLLRCHLGCSVPAQRAEEVQSMASASQRRVSCSAAEAAAGDSPANTNWREIVCAASAARKYSKCWHCGVRLEVVLTSVHVRAALFACAWAAQQGHVCAALWCTVMNFDVWCVFMHVANLRLFTTH